MTDSYRLKISVVSSLPATSNSGRDSTGLVARTRPFHLSLLHLDYEILPILEPDVMLAKNLARLKPDVIIIDAGADGRLALERVLAFTVKHPLPVICFTDEPDPAKMRAALHAGVAAYVVAGFSAERVRSVLDVAIARFQINQTMRIELEEARRKANTANPRRLKSEDEAYRKLRCLATDKNLSLSDVALRMKEVADLLI